MARRNPVLLHGPVAALWLQREGGIEDKEVLEAVRCHTTGQKGMGPVAKVVFLADKLDPHKVARDPRFERLAALAQESLDHALLEFLNQQLAYFLRQWQAHSPRFCRAAKRADRLAGRARWVRPQKTPLC